MSQYQESWSITKPAIEAGGGMVVSQHHTASQIGAAVLEAGGNAVDAAAAAGFAIGTVEPWMSGLGGCGNMLYYEAATGQCHGVGFGVRSGGDVDPSRYPLDGSTGADLFSWPAVVENRNVFGPSSVAVPGYVAGMASALGRFGSMSFADVLHPAIGLAREGMAVDWYASLKIASAAPMLSRFPTARDTYLPGGFAPVGEWGGPLPRIELSGLADTLQQLASAGADDFYTGDIAASLVADAAAMDMPLNARDLAEYSVQHLDAAVQSYRDSSIYSMPGLTAGPTLNHALDLVESHEFGDRPDNAAYRAYTLALIEAYDHRLSTMGDADEVSSPSSTTHLSVVDRHGNVVALTQTLLSVFGSKVVMPGSGILMNNGLMWFDPRPGRPNSLAAAKWPLSNMCPAILVNDSRRVALGASGGRRIMPAVYQLISFLADYDMSIEAATHSPRVDVSGSPAITIDNRLDETVPGALPDGYQTERAPNGVYPALFACPNVAEFDVHKGVCRGSAFIPSPWALAAGAALDD